MEHTKVIDSDGHVVEFSFTKDENGKYVEGNDCWKEYLEKKYRERRPRIVIDNWGHENFMFEGKMIPDEQEFGQYFGMYDHILRPGGYDPHLRLKDMDEEVVLPAVFEEMGAEHFMYASDYPHYGDSITSFGEVAKWRNMEAIDDSARRQVRGDAAARFYRLDS